jgi:hypothetical protein
VPALNVARVTNVKSLRPATLRGFEQALEELGYSRREARCLAANGFAGLAAAPQDVSAELIAAIKAATQLFTKV